MFGGSGFRWTVVVLTCQHKDSVYSFQRGESPQSSVEFLKNTLITQSKPRFRLLFGRGRLLMFLRSDQTSVYFISVGLKFFLYFLLRERCPQTRARTHADKPAHARADRDTVTCVSMMLLVANILLYWQTGSLFTEYIHVL